MERAGKASVAKRSTAERVSRVSDASERTEQATKWPVQNAIFSDKKRPLSDEKIWETFVMIGTSMESNAIPFDTTSLLEML